MFCRWSKHHTCVTCISFSINVEKAAQHHHTETLDLSSGPAGIYTHWCFAFYVLRFSDQPCVSSIPSQWTCNKCYIYLFIYWQLHKSCALFYGTVLHELMNYSGCSVCLATLVTMSLCPPHATDQHGGTLMLARSSLTTALQRCPVWPWTFSPF